MIAPHPGARRRARSLRPVAVALILAAWLAPAGTAMAQTPEQGLDDDDLVVLSGRVHVGPEEEAGAVIVFSGPVTIEGTVREDVLVFSGDTEVSGTVAGDVTVLDGEVTVRSGAEIGGNLESQARPRIEPGATVRGVTRRVTRVDFPVELGFLSGFPVWLAVTVSTLVFGILLILFAPRAAESLVDAARERTGASVGWGVGLFFLLPVGAVVAIVTLVGIPLGVGLLLGLALVYSTGYIACCHVLGRLIVKRPTSQYVSFLAGVGLLRGIALIPVVGGLTWLFASIFGLGVLAASARRATRSAAPAPATTAPGAAPGSMPPPPPMPSG